MTALRIAIIDDDQGVRDTLAFSLNVKGHAPHTFESALHFRDTQDPEDFDVILLDYMMPDLDGTELLAHYHARQLDTPVIMMSSERDPRVAHAAGGMGSVTWLPKPIEWADLKIALDKAVQRRNERADERSRSRASAERITSEQRQGLERLTPKEWEVLLLLAGEELSSPEIAEKLGCSPRTVQTHRDSIAEKLGTRSLIAMYRLLVAVGKL